MGVPNKYRGINRSIRLNTSDTDVLLGVAYQDLFGMAVNTAGDYILTSGNQESDPIETSFDLVEATGSFVEKVNIDFDLIFQTTQILDGTFSASMPLGANVGNQGSAIIRATAEVIHFDGTTEFSLGSATSPSEDDEFSTSTSRSTVFAVSFELTRQLFKIGDTLRITVTIDVRKSGSDLIGTGYLGHDPANRTSDNLREPVSDSNETRATTQMHFRVPVVIST